MKPTHIGVSAPADTPRDAFDLIVVGGGIMGAWVARDAAARGMRVALFEQGDIAGGTSSRTSKLVHGGLRNRRANAPRGCASRPTWSGRCRSCSPSTADRGGPPGWSASG
jgi:glycine/D-amino acid oxidase-like deaminating enzyme